MDREKYLEILETFIPSVEMREYLATQELSDRWISNIILGAPVPLTTKLKYAAGEDYDEIKQAIDELNLKSNELFYLIDNWYDDDIYDENGCGNAPFSNFEKVVEHICTYRYILIEDEVCFFEREEFLKNGLTRVHDYRFFNSTDLNLPVPFKVGDVVTIDCRPFAPVRQVKITGIGDNHDCCSLQAEFYDNKEKEYKTGAVKHCFIFDNGYRPNLSPLYRMSKVN